MDFKREKVLITGLNSFIGRRLMDSFDAEFFEIGRDTYPKLDNYDNLVDRLMVWKPDIILHLASAGSKIGNYSEQEIFNTNVVGTWNLLRASRDVPYRAFINFGSSSEYGNKTSSMREDDVLNPNFLYASTKAAAHQLCRAEAMRYDKPIVTVRPFSVYGKGMQRSKLIPALFRSAYHGEQVNLVDGVHDFIHVSDLVTGIHVVIENAHGLRGEAVNFGSGKETTNIEMADMVGEVAGKGLNIQTVVSLVNHEHFDLDSRVWRANINTAKTLGWKPTVSLREGLEEMNTVYEKYSI